MPETILGMPRQMALWVIGGGVLLVVVVLAMRRKSATPSMDAAMAIDEGLALPGGPGSSTGASGLLEAQPDQQAGFARQLEELAFKSQRMEYEFGQQQLQGQMEQYKTYQGVQQGILDWASGKKGSKLPKAVKCPDGQPRLDPATMTIYCRTEQSKGFVGDYITPALGQLAGSYIGSYSGPGGAGWGTPSIPGLPRQQQRRKTDKGRGPANYGAGQSDYGISGGPENIYI